MTTPGGADLALGGGPVIFGFAACFPGGFGLLGVLLFDVRANFGNSLESQGAVSLMEVDAAPAVPCSTGSV